MGQSGMKRDTHENIELFLPEQLEKFTEYVGPSLPFPVPSSKDISALSLVLAQ